MTENPTQPQYAPVSVKCLSKKRGVVPAKCTDELRLPWQGKQGKSSMILQVQVATQIVDSSPLLKKQKESQNVLERYVCYMTHVTIVLIML